MREYGFFTENLYSRIFYAANFRTFCGKTDNAKMGINSFEKNISFYSMRKVLLETSLKKLLKNLIFDVFTIINEIFLVFYTNSEVIHLQADKAHYQRNDWNSSK